MMLFQTNLPLRNSYEHESFICITTPALQKRTVTNPPFSRLYSVIDTRVRPKVTTQHFLEIPSDLEELKSLISECLPQSLEANGTLSFSYSMPSGGSGVFRIGGPEAFDAYLRLRVRPPLYCTECKGSW